MVDGMRCVLTSNVCLGQVIVHDTALEAEEGQSVGILASSCQGMGAPRCCTASLQP